MLEQRFQDQNLEGDDRVQAMENEVMLFQRSVQTLENEELVHEGTSIYRSLQGIGEL